MHWRLLLGCAGIVAGCVAQAADLRIQAEPGFVGFGQSGGVTPVAVILKNIGADARGTLQVTSGGFQMDYPIELPRGTVKRLLTYPVVDYGGEVELNLNTNQGSTHMVFHQMVAGDSSAQSILYIGDGQGDLGFLRQQGAEASSRMIDSYVKPELAPDRPIAYSSISTVFLGPGSDRLSDGAVRALHLYLSSGGTVAFSGGASSPVTSDRRWTDVMPVQTGLPKTIRQSRLIEGLSSTALGAPFTVLDARLAPDSAARIEDGNIIFARRDVGLGKTAFFAFDPLDRPFTRWPGRRALFEKVLRPLDSSRASGYLQQFTVGGDDSGMSGYAGYSYTTTAGGGYYSGPYPYEDQYASRKDPFSTQLPPASKVFWILTAYFVVIVPINFILLRKLKKGELAWFTAPLISVGFAGAFFAAAKDLYTAKLSTATQGLIVAVNDAPEAVFVGKSQLFFPQGGEYDLKMAGVESVGAAGSIYDYGYRRYRGPGEQNSMEGVNPIDIGHILVSRMDVSNLAFRELAFRQIISSGRWLNVSLDRSGGKRTLIVTNSSPYDLNQVTAVVAGQAFTMTGSLARGESKRLSLPQTISPDGQQSMDMPPRIRYGGRPDSLQYSGLTELTTQTKEIVIKGLVLNAPVGPGIGDAVASRQNVMLAYFTGIHYGKVSL